MSNNVKFGGYEINGTAQLEIASLCHKRETFRQKSARPLIDLIQILPYFLYIRHPCVRHRALFNSAGALMEHSEWQACHHERPGIFYSL